MRTIIFSGMCVGCRRQQHLRKTAALLLLAAGVGRAAGLLRRQRGPGAVREAGLAHELAHALAGGAAARRSGVHGLHHRGGHLCTLRARLQPVEALRSSNCLYERDVCRPCKSAKKGGDCPQRSSRATVRHPRMLDSPSAACSSFFGGP